MSLDSPEYRKIFEVAQEFTDAYADWHFGLQHQGNGLRAAKVLSRLAILERVIDDHVSRETEALKERLDGKGEDPPF